MSVFASCEFYLVCRHFTASCRFVSVLDFVSYTVSFRPMSVLQYVRFTVFRRPMSILAVCTFNRLLDLQVCLYLPYVIFTVFC